METLHDVATKELLILLPPPPHFPHKKKKFIICEDQYILKNDVNFTKTFRKCMFSSQRRRDFELLWHVFARYVESVSCYDYITLTVTLRLRYIDPYVDCYVTMCYVTLCYVTLRWATKPFYLS